GHQGRRAGFDDLDAWAFAACIRPRLDLSGCPEEPDLPIVARGKQRAVSDHPVAPVAVLRRCRAIRGFQGTPETVFGSHREIFAPYPLVRLEIGDRAFIAQVPLLDDAGPVGDARRESQVLLREQHGQTLSLEPYHRLG